MFRDFRRAYFINGGAAYRLLSDPIGPIGPYRPLSALSALSAPIGMILSRARRMAIGKIVESLHYVHMIMTSQIVSQDFLSNTHSCFPMSCVFCGQSLGWLHSSATYAWNSECGAVWTHRRIEPLVLHRSATKTILDQYCGIGSWQIDYSVDCYA